MGHQKYKLIKFKIILFIGFLNLFLGQSNISFAQLTPVLNLNLPITTGGSISCGGNVISKVKQNNKTLFQVKWDINWTLNPPDATITSYNIYFDNQIWGWNKNPDIHLVYPPSSYIKNYLIDNTNLPLNVSENIRLTALGGNQESDKSYLFMNQCSTTLTNPEVETNNNDLLDLRETDAISSPTYDSNPNYSFQAYSDGTLKYSGSCGEGSVKTISSSVGGVITTKYSNLKPGNYKDCTITLSKNGKNGKILSVKPFEVLSSGSDSNLDLVEVEPVPFQSNEKSPTFKILTKSDGDLSYSGSCGNGDLKKASQSNVYAIKFNNLAAGTYSNCAITLSKNNKSGKALILSKFIIIENGQGGNSGNNNQNSNNDTGTGTDAGNNNSNGNNQNQGNSENNNTENGKTQLVAGPDIMNCKKRADILYFENDKPAYDYFSVDCNLTQGAVIFAEIHNSSFDPKIDDHSGSLVKVVKSPMYFDKSKFSATWGGYDDYDQAVQLGDYKFVVFAKLGDGFKPDISIQNFKIDNVPEKKDDEKDLHPSADENKVIDEGELPNIIDEEDKNKENQTDKELSKCPNIFYPKDIAGHPLEDIIKQAYDKCLVKGYEDGSFRPAQGLTRAEATKIIVLATGNIAKQGCYDEDCGSPFVDLDMWQGPWVRSAWDNGFVSGVGKDRFAPNLNITKGEAAALIVKSFKIPAFIGCYTANCGAGHPNNFFRDIVKDWQGQYLRPLWDRKIISNDSQGFFYPDLPISRGEILNWIFKINPDVNNSKANLPTVVPPSTAK